MNKFITKDFYLSATLLAYDFTLINSKKENEGVYFEFSIDNNELFQKISQDFINQTCMVNVKKFTISMAKLRRELDKYRR